MWRLDQFMLQINYNWGTIVSQKKLCTSSFTFFGLAFRDDDTPPLIIMKRYVHNVFVVECDDLLANNFDLLSVHISLKKIIS